MQNNFNFSNWQLTTFPMSVSTIPQMVYCRVSKPESISCRPRRNYGIVIVYNSFENILMTKH